MKGVKILSLKLGYMSRKELAAWFGIKDKTYENYRVTYLKKLEDFAKFTIVRGGVKIEEIYIAEYVKNLDNDVEVYLKEVKEANENITSVTGMSEKLCETEEYANIPVRTMRDRMTRAGKKAFGITAEEGSRGIYGSREYLWAIKEEGLNAYRRLTAAEEEVFDKLLVNYYSSEPEKIKKAALLEETFRKSKEMTKEEYFREKERLNVNLFYDVIQQFKAETGLQVVRATVHEIDAW